MTKLFLRPNVQVEPLFDSWYAWSHLIPPATAARNVTERHLKIMESYINAPQVHASAVKNPKMLGGPFIDYGGKRVAEIAALRDNTKHQLSQLLELSKAIADLDDLLASHAAGFSLQPLYAKVPGILRGYVELVYDLNNHPSFRLIEPLLYRSKFYSKSAQSLMLSAITGDDRPFVLSTPRLPTPNSLHLNIPFDDERVDSLFRLKQFPSEWCDIVNKLEIEEEQQGSLRTMFTDEAPPQYAHYTGQGVRWRYFGHACILVEARGKSLLFDPVLSYTYESDISRYTYQDLPDDIDFVLITHSHQDHILFETLLQIRHKVKNIIVPRASGGALQDPSVKLLLRHAGFSNIVEFEPFETIDLDGFSICGIPFLGEHADLDVGSKLAYLVRIGRHSLLFAADSCNIEPAMYEHIHREIGDVDALFLGMECDGAPLTWLYGPLLTRKIERAMDESRRLAGSNYEQAVDIVRRFNCKEAYVYAMGQEPWLNFMMNIKYSQQSRPIVDSDKLIADCRARGMTAERLFGEKEILLQP